MGEPHLEYCGVLEAEHRENILVDEQSKHQDDDEDRSCANIHSKPHTLELPTNLYLIVTTSQECQSSRHARRVTGAVCTAVEGLPE